MKALIIDDSRAVRAFIRPILQELGYETFEAPNGLAGLEVLTTHDDIQIVLVDWNMPEMDGLEFIQRVRSQSEFSALKIMMVTTETEAEQMLLAMNAGANEYVMKPFGREVLLAKLGMLDLF